MAPAGEGGKKRKGGGATRAGDGQGEQRSSSEVRTALIEGNTFRAKPVQYVVLDGLAIVEGDIVIGTEEEVQRQTEQLRDVISGRLAAAVMISGDQFRWPNCVVPYTIDPALPNQSRVTDAIAHWQDKTRFRFVARTTEADYVTFRPGSGCSASVGKRGGQQFINLGTGCSKGNVIHEIGHAIGLWHEQSREDRDAFVTINWPKIQSGFEHNFNQHITDGDDVGPYDYGSIMHYPRNAFSVDGSDTITPLDPTAQIGQRTALSAGDIAAVNTLCPKPLKETIKDVRKDPVKEVRLDPVKQVRWDTRKEIVKDIRFDTRKEILADTRKELVKERIKEAALDPTWRKPAADSIGPIGPVQPGPLVSPSPGALPFAVATPHHAPAAGTTESELEGAVTDLDAQLQALAEQLAQAEATRDVLQAQYDETAALLRQALEAHDQGTQ